MKRINGILLLSLLLLGMIITSGCSSNEQRRFPQREGFQGMPDVPINISEEERQQMFEERLQKAIEACQGKNEGDSCQFEEHIGDLSGICKIMDENLVCITDRPMRQR